MEVIAIEDVTVNGTPLSPYIYVSLKTSSDITLLKELAAKIGWTICGTEFWDENVKILCALPGSNARSLDASCYLAETGDFNYVDPGFDSEIKYQYTPSDPNFSLQWNLKSYPGIDLSSLWDLTLGENITLGIVDTGIFRDNPDFSSHMHSFSYRYDGLNSSLPYNKHGTMVTSIAASSHNNDGFAGVAPNVKIMDINIGNSDPDKRMLGIEQAISNGADVLNCSWHCGNKDGHENLETFIERVAAKGRNGKGTVVVFAAGNDSIKGLGIPGKKIPSAIRVGAVDKTGKVCRSSSRGSELDVVAPGENLLVWQSSMTFGYAEGTSLSAAHVSGLACLILSLRPDLTAAQVKQLIIETASRSTHSNDYGWGIVDPEYALIALQHKFSFEKTNSPVRFTVNNKYTFKLAGVPRGATTKWSASVGALDPKTATYNSATFTYPETGMFSENVSATVTYMGRTTTFTLDCTVENPVEITAVEIDDVNQGNGNEIYLYAVCSKAHPQLQWEIVGSSMSFTLQDFPLAGDANYIDTWEKYICLSYDPGAQISVPNGAWCRLKVSMPDYGIEHYCTVRRSYDTWIVE